MWKTILHRWIEPEVRRRVQMALAETDNTLLIRAQAWGENERLTPDREQTLEQALHAWRTNPLARRIVELTTEYVIGGGLAVVSPQAEAQTFLQRWWEHPLNRLPMRTVEWCDELSRAGELFLLLSTDAGGMTYVRAIPALQIRAIRTAENDLQQEIACLQVDGAGGERWWQVYNPQNDMPDEQGRFAPAILHYAINRPVGAVRGESDLAPLLRWLNRYAGWLEDRARLNRYRNTFLFTVRSRFASEAERLARQQTLAANPPMPGSILVTDEGEEWSVIQPHLESHEAGEDGLALKKMIAAGAGIPLHFLAEPESATRTTAEAAGGPAYRRLEQRQKFFCWLVEDTARACLRRWAWIHGRRGEFEVQVRGADLSARDNASLAAALAHASGALMRLYERGLIGESELLRLVYRFAGETAPASANPSTEKKGG